MLKITTDKKSKKQIASYLVIMNESLLKQGDV